MRTYSSSRVKKKAFIEKVNSRCFCWFPAAILVHQNGTPIWRLHTKLYKAAWNVSANNSETVSHKDLKLGQIVYILVFYNISFSWLLPLDSFQVIVFFCCVTVKTIYNVVRKALQYIIYRFWNDSSLGLINAIWENPKQSSLAIGSD